MGFKRITNDTPGAATPEQLFADLRTRTIPGLIAHQADVLREYMKCVDERDVALQLPTGSGKTLVGLLIAEWRRRKYREPVAYFCPTRLLVNQVAEQSRSYGIRVMPLVGRHADFAPADKADYSSGSAVAVTTYSALFNVRPYFDNANTLIFDDAHAAETYVARYWSLHVTRKDHETLFDAVASVLGRTLTSTDLQRFTAPEVWDRGWVELIPAASLAPLSAELTTLIREHVQETDLRYPWSVLEGRIGACNLYIGPQAFLLRPFIPPTTTHDAFERPRQRVYMSATLGEGGDLERLWGRESIKRLPIPPGWDTRGIGRRFFMFPEVVLDDAATGDLLVELVKEPPRTLMLVPDSQSENSARTFFAERCQKTLYSASDLESSKATFVADPDAIAICANRYDGMDLAGDDCRLLIVSGLPEAMNLQERFLVTRVGASILLRDRIVTRVTQAVGRCTRSDTDYAAVVIMSAELTKFFLDARYRRQLHPEMQAEVEYGLDQSRDDADAFAERLRIFLEHGDEWQDADQDLIALRASKQRDLGPEVLKLRAAAAHEVKFQYSAWRSDYVSAIESARSVLSSLGGDDVRGYRAFWNYLAGAAASMGTAAGIVRLADTARDFYGRAAGNAIGISWLARLRDVAPESAKDAGDPLLWSVIEQLEEQLDNFGLATARAFDKEERAILGGLASNDAGPLESAHERLGRVLGYTSANANEDAAPDPWWIASDKLCIVFEDHTNVVDANAPIGANKVRQAASHPNWIKDHVRLASDAQCIAVLASPRKTLTRGAASQVGDLCYWNLDEFRAWGRTALGVVRELWSSYPGPGDLAWRAEAAAKYEQNNISPARLTAFLRSRPLRALAVSAAPSDESERE